MAGEKENFDNAVKDLEIKYQAVLSADSFGDLSLKEREAVQALMALQFHMFKLDNWVRDARNRRYLELQNPAPEPAEERDPATEETPGEEPTGEEEKEAPKKSGGTVKRHKSNRKGGKDAV